MSEYMVNNDQKIKKLKRVVVKEEYVKLTGDIAKAIILNQFIYWSERVQDFDKFITEEQVRCQQDGTKINIQLSNGWIYKSSEELSDETMLNLSASNIRKHLKDLIKEGWISERTNPVHKWDRTIQYRVNLAKISKDLLKLGYVLQDYKIELPFFETKNAFSVLENGTFETENQSSILENQTLRNRKAIPEITTKIDGLMDGVSDATKDNQIANKNSQNQEEDAQAQVSVLLSQLCKATGANPGQVQEAIRRANRMEKEGKLKGNYLKLVESIAKTVVQEDLLRNNKFDDCREIKKNTNRASPAPHKNKFHDAKKELIKSLYMS